MKLNLIQRSLFLLTGLSLLSAGCGESFIGNFSGDAQVTADGCPFLVQRDYKLEVRTSISGNSMSMVVVNLSPKGNGRSSDDATKIINGLRLDAKIENDTRVVVDQQDFENDPATVSADGTINEARDEINGLTIVLNGELTVTEGDSSNTCDGEIRVSSKQLKLIP